jgi:hypothetical protein
VWSVQECLQPCVECKVRVEWCEVCDGNGGMGEVEVGLLLWLDGP